MTYIDNMSYALIERIVSVHGDDIKYLLQVSEQERAHYIRENLKKTSKKDIERILEIVRIVNFGFWKLYKTKFPKYFVDEVFKTG